MFELENLSAPKPESIALQTARGTDIENQFGPELSEGQQKKYRAFLANHGQNWSERKKPDSRYNCAGHIWAAKRTAIYNKEAWEKILEEDGYQRTENPCQGDLVLYVSEQSGILHIGRIIEMRSLSAGSEQEIPFIISKWDDWTGEVVHSVYDSPYHHDEWEFRVVFWTDRYSFLNRE